MNKACPEGAIPPKERDMRSPWIYRLGTLAALMLAGGAGLKWP
jgi:hypothetical protein